MAEGVLVFDDAAEITVEGGVFGRSFILVDDGPDAMVFDLELAREQRELTGQDLLVFDGDQTVTQVTQGEPNLILMDAPAAPSSAPRLFAPPPAEATALAAVRVRGALHPPQQRQVYSALVAWPGGR